jgi:hypothetical protein
MRSSKRSNLILLIITVVLLASIAVLAVWNQRSGAGEKNDGSLTVYRGEEAVKKYRLAELKDFPSVEREKTISSGKQTDESGVFTGVPLETILNDAVPDWGNIGKDIQLCASDGFTTSVSPSDIEKGENVLLVYAKDDVPLRGPEEGGKGPLRIVIMDDSFGNRSAYLLTSIRLAE